MGSQIVLVLLVLASGFVAAGLLNALHRSVIAANEDENGGRLVLYFDTPGAIAWSMLMCVFAGPFIVLSNGLYLWRQNLIPAIGLTLCVVLSAVWSFCSGVFIVEMVAALNQW